MDVMMPGEDGIFATSKMLAQGPVRIVLMSQAEPAKLRIMRVNGLESGAMEVVKKPVGAAETNRLLRLCRDIADQPIGANATAAVDADPSATTKTSAGRPAVQGPGYLIADDSALVLQILEAAFTAAGLRVVGLARDGEEAVAMTEKFNPDLVVMDVKMPRCDGITALRRMMNTSPRRVLLISGADHDELGAMSFDGVAAGALDVIAKPAGPREVDRLVSKARLLTGVPIRTARLTKLNGRSKWQDFKRAKGELEEPAPVKRSTNWSPRLVAIAASTGGPGTLIEVLKVLPANYRMPLLLVQHMSPGFDGHFCTWLENEPALKVRLAEDGLRIEPGVLYVAPCDYHMEVNARMRLSLHQGPKESQQRPAATVLFRSVSKALGERAWATTGRPASSTCGAPAP